DADGMDILGPLGDAQMAVDRAAFLREAGHIENARALALQMRGHAKNAANGDNAGAADAGDDDVVGLLDLRQCRLRQRLQRVIASDAVALLQLAAVNRHERRAEALQTREVLVTGRLVDGALAAELRLQRLHRYAVGFHTAVAAALADKLIDDDALVRIRECAALPATP